MDIWKNLSWEINPDMKIATFWLWSWSIVLLQPFNSHLYYALYNA